MMILDNTVIPVFTNVDWTVTVADDTPISTTIYTAEVTENPTVTMTTPTTMLTFNSEASNAFTYSM